MSARLSRSSRRTSPFWLGLVVAIGCAGVTPGLSEVLEFGDGEDEGNMDWHRGPEVSLEPTGPARFVRALNEGFDVDRAMRLVRFADRFYRAPANDGYEAVLQRMEEMLGEAGFGKDDPRLTLEYIATEAETPGWNPKRGLVELLVPDGETKSLHSFDKEEDADRVMLPINAPPCDVTGRVAMQLEDLEEGMILVTEVPTHQVLQRAKNRGAAAVISASLQPFNNDPSGQDRHRDAIQYRIFRNPPGLPIAQISPRSFGTIEAAWLRNKRVQVHLKADVEYVERPLRTLVATIVGHTRPEECVAMSSHVQEPGASDNATGVAGLCESAIDLAMQCQEGTIAWPDRSVVFLWGDEFRQTQDFLDRTELRPVIGISSDMTGQSAETGAIALLERMPDPGAISPLDPDEHTPWGAGDVEAEDLSPNGLAVIARCAMIDVGREEEDGWVCADHPWEGGSDHDIYIDRGIPAILFWHFTDFTYHTSIDRLDFVDPQEMRRTAVALLATALAVADPEPADLDRYLKSLQLEEDVRVAAAEAAEDDDLAEMWRDWCRGAREWLRNECLGIDEKLPEGR